MVCQLKNKCFYILTSQNNNNIFKGIAYGHFMAQWYKVNVYRAHRGTGRNESVLTFFHAKDVLEIIQRYKRMPGVKINIHKFFPDITLLSEKEIGELEKKIIAEKIISLERAKRTWYYSERN